LKRVCAVANAYKHSGPLNAKHPITSESDGVWATGAGFSIDGYGVGKFSGGRSSCEPESGARAKILGDVPWSIAGWFKFLGRSGRCAPAERSFVVSGLGGEGRVVPPHRAGIRART